MIVVVVVVDCVLFYSTTAAMMKSRKRSNLKMVIAMLMVAVGIADPADPCHGDNRFFSMLNLLPLNLPP